MEKDATKSKSTPTRVKRALSYMLVSAMVFSGFNMVPMTKMVAKAASVNPIISGSETLTMENGEVYSVNGNVTRTAGAGYSAIKVADGATVTIDIPSGSSLTAIGGAGSGTTGGGAGIEVPSSSTLIITGAGTLNATGGEGGTSTAGTVGSGGDYNGNGAADLKYGGTGGTGGAGAGGAGAGIGTKGGNGGNGGNGGTLSDNLTDTTTSSGHAPFWVASGSVGNANSGYSSNTMGTVKVYGTVKVIAKGGNASKASPNNNANIAVDMSSKYVESSNDLVMTGKGQGGYTGGISGVGASIGSGAPGGGGGYGGTGGPIVAVGDYNYDSRGFYHEAQEPKNAAIDGCKTHLNTYAVDFYRYTSSVKTGKIGSAGDAGILQVASGASVTMNTATNINNGTGINASISALSDDSLSTKVAITFNDANGATTVNSQKSITYYSAATSTVNVPSKTDYVFGGYYTAADGAGSKIYDANGKLVKSVTNYIDASGKWIQPADTTLYAYWIPFVKFNQDGGNGGAKDFSIETGTVVPTVNVPSKTGYTFNGYYSGDTQIFDATGKPIKNVSGFIDASGRWTKTETTTLTAKWTANTVTSGITFSNSIEQDYFDKKANPAVTTYSTKPVDIDTVYNTESVTISELTDNKTNNDPVRAGYTFAGFADELTGGTLVFKADGTLASESIISKKYGTIVKGGKWVYEDVLTLYAQWTPLKYNFTFDVNTGDGNNVTLKDLDISNGEPSTVTIAKQMKPGQQLLGYSIRPISNIEDLTVDQLNSALIYKPSADDTTIFNIDKNVATERPVGIDDPDTAADESRDITFYAVWGTAQYQVAYYDRDWNKLAVNDATVDRVSTSKIGELQDFAYGEFMLKSLDQVDSEYAPTFNDGEKVSDYYNFIGWSTTPYSTSADYEPRKQYQGGLTTTSGEIVNVYAVWAVKEGKGANIRFDGNGNAEYPAYDIPADDSVVYDMPKNSEVKTYAEYTLEKRYIPVRKDYTFLGWADKATETDKTKIYNNKEHAITVKITKDTVFYAQWRKNPSITYDINGGTITAIPKKIYEIDKTVAITDIVPERLGWDFKGWILSTKNENEKTEYWCKTPKEGTEPLQYKYSWEEVEETDEKVAKLGADDTFIMPYNDVVATAQWAIKYHTVDVKFTTGEAEDNHKTNATLYTLSGEYTYEYTYNGVTTNPEDQLIQKNDATITDNTDENNPVYSKELVDPANAVTNAYSRELPYGSDLTFSIIVADTHDSDTMTINVKIGDAEPVVYKPISIGTFEVKEGEGENEKVVKTLPKYTYLVSNITKPITITIGDTKQYKYDIHYVDPSGLANKKIGDNDVIDLGIVDLSYYAGVVETLPTEIESTVLPKDYKFVGWYADKNEALNITANNKGLDDSIAKAVTNIPITEREAKTFYAAWQGKNYTVNYYTKNFKVNFSTEDETPVLATEQFGRSFTVGTKGLAAANPDTPNTEITIPKGPNGATFLGWAKTATAKTPDYTPGETVTDLAKSGEDSVDLYAVWDISKLTFTFDTNGGYFTEAETVRSKTFSDLDYRCDFEKVLEKVSSYVETMYRPPSGAFKGWATTPNPENNEPDVADATGKPLEGKNVKLYENDTFYAVWSEGEVTIKYYTDSTGSTEAGVKNYTVGSPVTIGEGINVTPPDGQSLIGWASASGSTSPVRYTHLEQRIADENLFTNLYPVFKLNTIYNITYDTNGGTTNGTLGNTQGVVSGEAPNISVTYTLKSSPIPTKTGYKFIGWSTTKNKADTLIDGNTLILDNPDKIVTVYAYFEPAKYTFTYNAGRAIPAADLSEYANVANVGEPKLKTIAANEERFVVDGTSYVQTFTYDMAGALVPCQYEYPGFEFVGWTETDPTTEGYSESKTDIAFTEGQAVKNLTTESGNLKTLYAVWKPDSAVTVTYNANGGKEVAEGSAPETEKYLNILNDKNKIDIKLCKNSKTVGEGDQAVTTPLLEREGYKFIGWSKTAQTLAANVEVNEAYMTAHGIIAEGGDDSIDVSTTYYAVWQAYKTFKLEYKLNAGKGSVPVDDNVYCEDGKSYAGNKVKVLFDPIPTRDGYTFVGWSTDSEDTHTATDATPDSVDAHTATDAAPIYKAPAEGEETPTFTIVENTTLFARWLANTYKIKYFGRVPKKDAQGNDVVEDGKVVYETGDLGIDQTCTYDKEVTLDKGTTTNPAIGYKFIGWALTDGGTIAFDTKEAVKNLSTGVKVENTETHVMEDPVINLYAVYGPKTYSVVLVDDIDNDKYSKNLDKFKFNQFTQADIVGTSYNVTNKTVNEKYSNYVLPDPVGVYPVYEVKFGETLKDIKAPSVYGFDFAGYQIDKDHVYYDASGNPVVVDEYSATKAVAEKDTGYEFDKSLGNEVIVLKGVWAPHVFDVKFIQVTNNDTELEIDAVKGQIYGETFTMPHKVKGIDPSNDYTVVGWTPYIEKMYPKTVEEFKDAIMFELDKTYDADTIAALYNNDKADVKLYPVYKTTKQYDVHFIADGATNVPATQKVALNDNFVVDFDDVVFTIPKKEGYTFAGWQQLETDAEGNVVKDKETGKTNVVKTFAWPKAAEATAADYTIENIDRTIVLEAIWAPNQYEIRYHGKSPKDTDEKLKEVLMTDVVAYENFVVDEDGKVTDEVYKFATGEETIKVEEEDKLIFEGYKGYTLVGWTLTKGSNKVDYKLGAELDKALAINKGDAIDVYAVWVKGDYQVVFNKNLDSATGTMANQTMSYEYGEAIDMCQFKADDYTFAGWALNPKATAPTYKDEENVDFDEAVVVTEGGNVVNLYAIWTPVIKTTDKTVKYEDAGWDVSKMFTIPAKAGEATYTLTEAEGAKLAEGKTLTVAKSGTYEITVDTAVAEGITVSTAKAEITVEKADAVGTVKTYNGEAYSAETETAKFVEAKDEVKAQVVFKSPTDENYKPNIAFTYKVEGTSDETYSDVVPTKAGKYTVRAIVEDTDKYAGFTKTANFEITSKEQAEGSVAIYVGEATESTKTVPYIDAFNENYAPKITLTTGDQTEANVTYEYKAYDAGDGTYVSAPPAKAGKYVVRATVAETKKYLGFEATYDFEIVDKLQADGELKTYNGNEEATSFVEAKDTVVAKLTITAPTAEEDPEYKPVPKYTYKVAGTNDETYTDEVPTTAGKYTVRAVVADTDKYIGFTKTANFEIKAKVQAEGTVAIYIGEATESTKTVPYIDAFNKNYAPKITLTTGDQTEANVTYEYKAYDAGDGTYVSAPPAKAGKYVVRATVAETKKYLGFEATYDFEIVEKIQAAGTVATFNGENETSEFMEAEDLVITPKVIFTVPEEATEIATINVTYEYKVSTASDSTYKSFKEEMPSEIGTYTVRAVVADTDKYVGFTKTANFKITEDPEKAEAIAKAAAVVKADEDTSKRLQDTYETLKNSNNYSAGQLAALEAAYNTAKADLETAVTDTIANNSEITSAGVPAAAEAALATAKSALLDAVKSTAENEAAAKAVADAKANAEAALAAAEDALKNENAIQEDKDAITKAKSDVETAKAAVEGLAEDASNDDKEAAAKALQDAVDALDTAVDTSNLHAAIAEAVMNQENIQPFVKKVATDSLEEYAERIKPDDLNEAEAKDYNDAIAAAKKAIEDAANNEEVLSTLAAVKEDVKAAANEINDTRAANAAKEAAEAAAATAETLAEEAKANEYASEADKKAIDDAKNTLDDAKETLAAAETNEAKNEAAKAVNDAVKTLQDATDTANTNSADAKKAADEAAAAKAAAEAAATTAETLAEEAKANEYASEADKKAIDDAKNTLDDAKEALAAAETNEAKNAAAEAVNDAVKALQEATDKANANSATAKKTAEALAAAKKEAKDRLEDVYDAKNKDDYRADQQKALADAKNAGDKAIDAATTSDEVAKALTDAKAAINAVKTDSKLTKEEKDAADSKAAKDATDKINAIGKVTTDSKGAIDAARNAYNALTADQKKLVPANVVTILTTAEKTYQTLAAKAAEEAKKKAAEEAAKQPKINPDKETFFTLFLHASKVTKNSITLSWTKVDGATKYIVYGGRYGAKAKKITGTSGTKSTRSKLSAGKFYRYYVVAYNAKGEKICTSAKVYVVTKGGKYTNYKSISTKAAGNKVNLATGETFNIGAKVKKSDSKLTLKKIHGLKYASTNPKIAKVDKKGKITAVSKGTCYVYVYAQNGVYKKIKVTVE